jgi:hypothetical protein
MNAPHELLPISNLEKDATPLEVLSQSLEQNDQVRRFRGMLESYYGKQSPSKRKDNNYTIIQAQSTE